MRKVTIIEKKGKEKERLKWTMKQNLKSKSNAIKRLEMQSQNN